MDHVSKQQDKKEERKTKRQKNREKNQFNKQKYDQDMLKFKQQLTVYGLRYKEMGGDGNCLFRSIADQLEGNEKMHRKYRQEAIDFIEMNKDDYAPFIEDDETIDQYLADLSRDGVWGGQMELQVLSVKYNFNYIVHQVDNPIMAFSNFPWGTVPTLHFSYHLGEHYNSVRLQEDPDVGPPMPIGHELQIKNPPVVEQTEVEESKALSDQKVESNQKSQSNEELTKEQLIQYALQVTGLTDKNLMEESLLTCFGKPLSISFMNIEQTLEVLTTTYEDLEMQQITKQLQEELILTENKDNKKSQQSEETKSKDKKKKKNGKSSGNEIEEYEKLREKLKDSQFILSLDGKNVIQMPQMNKKCPCDSKQQYKKCCYKTDQERKDKFVNQTASIETNNNGSQQKVNNTILLL